ncbi:MAG: hypothetical protein AB1673_04875 [Actinomycetota bacterium]
MTASRRLLVFVLPLLAAVAGGTVIWALAGRGGGEASVVGTGPGPGPKGTAGGHPPGGEREGAEGAPSTTAAAGQPVPTTAARDAPPTSASPTPSTTVAGPQVTTPTGEGERLHVKFATGTGARWREGRFVSLSGHDLSAVDAVLARSPVVRVERLFTRPEQDIEADRLAAEARTGLAQPDLNLYFRVVLASGAPAGPLVADLRALSVIEDAYPEPAAAPPPGGPLTPPPPPA